LPVDDVVVVTLASRHRAQGQSVSARGRFGYAECLQTKFAARDQRQITLFLRIAAVTQDRAHRVHLRMTGTTIAPGGVYLLHDRRGGGEIEPAASIFLGDEGSEVAGFCQRGHELSRIGSLPIERPPIFAGKLGAERAHAVANIGKFIVLDATFFHGPTLCSRMGLTSAPRPGPN